MKILIDTNVLIAAFMSKATSHEVMEQALHGNDLFYTDFIIKEFRRVLTKKFHYPNPLVQEFIRFMKRFFIKGETALAVEKICRDPDDNQILADAEVNEVDIIITGDKDLLVFGEYKGIKIIKPNEYWEL